MNKAKGMISLITALAAAALMLAGCGSVNIKVRAGSPQAPEAGQKEADPVFTGGVYSCCYEEEEDLPKTYFYVFNEDFYGHTEDGAHEDAGAPFDMEQSGDKVRFWFGGSEEDEVVLAVTSRKDGRICGYFENDPDRLLIFERIKDADPDDFSAQNYVNGPENSVYHDANGWSIRYDATKFDISIKDSQVFIVYTGASAGTNMITVTYTAYSKGKEAVKELGTSWGERTEYFEGPFPGDEDVTGYWAVLPTQDQGSGMYMTAIGRDYMDGALIFELTGHNGDDEEMNMAVSDDLASVIDSLTWDKYGDEQTVYTGGEQ